MPDFFAIQRAIVQNPVLLFILVVWELVWKGIALWKAAKSDHRNWFIVILVVNSLGILPIIYLVFFQKKRKK